MFQAQFQINLVNLYNKMQVIKSQNSPIITRKDTHYSLIITDKCSTEHNTNSILLSSYIMHYGNIKHKGKATWTYILFPCHVLTDKENLTKELKYEFYPSFLWYLIILSTHHVYKPSLSHHITDIHVQIHITLKHVILLSHSRKYKKCKI